MNTLMRACLYVLSFSAPSACTRKNTCAANPNAVTHNQRSGGGGSANYAQNTTASTLRCDVMGSRSGRGSVPSEQRDRRDAATAPSNWLERNYYITRTNKFSATRTQTEPSEMANKHAKHAQSHRKKHFVSARIDVRTDGRMAACLPAMLPVFCFCTESGGSASV